ncbi:unnamed protein product [Mytilus edulis]|uniref:Uncharacterized protein n=1 Tax=Mytilus edulis TaxID=6550 RepID=A0A8S3SF43_MYTED|nr:unnamed protein product [Mytilus edulis]
MGVCGIEDGQIIATVLTILACMINVIGFAAPYWYFDNNGKEDIYFGIWQYCTSNPATSCIKLPNIQTSCVLIGVIIYGTMAPLDWIHNIYFGFAFVIISAGIAVISACFICLCQQKQKLQIRHLKHYAIITKHS